jgi:microcystin-dependent protein
MPAPTWSQSRTVALDNNGVVAPGAKVFFFDAGTTTPRTVYQDGDLSTPHAHPVVADSSGRWPRVYLPYGDYAEKVTTSDDSQIWNDDNIREPEPFDDTQAVDPNNLVSTGDCFWSAVDAIRAGAVRLNGRTIGNASSSATERANADTEDLFTFLWNNLADAQAAVSGGRGGSAAADYAANKTIALPDLRGGIPVGLDDMGNSAGSFFTGVGFDHGDATTPGSALGSNTHALSEAELPSHTHDAGTYINSSTTHSHAISLTTSSDGSHNHGGSTVSAGDHSHTYPNAASTRGTAGGAGLCGDDSAGFTNTAGAHTHTISSDGSHTHTVSGNTATDGAHTHTVSGNSGATGSGTAHENVSKAILGTWYIKL